MSSQQQNIYRNNQHGISYMPIGGGSILLNSRFQNSPQIENFNSQPVPRFSQHYPITQQQQKLSNNNNVFPHQKIQPALKHSILQPNMQQPQWNSKSARNSPIKMVGHQRSINQPIVSKSPNQNVQQDLKQLMNQQYNQQLSQQQNQNPSQNYYNNSQQLLGSTSQIKYVGMNSNNTSSIGRESSVSPQPRLQRVQSVQNYIKVGQIVNENQGNIQNKSAVSSQLIPAQYYENQQNAQQVSSMKFIPNIQLQNYAHQMQPEILTPLVQNFTSISNIDDQYERKINQIDKKEGSTNLLSPKMQPASFMLAQNSTQSQNSSISQNSSQTQYFSTVNISSQLKQQQSQAYNSSSVQNNNLSKNSSQVNFHQQSNPQGILQLQNITNNFEQIQRNSVQVQAPKSRALSSIQFLKNNENQENKDENHEYSNTNLIQKKNANTQIQLHTHQSSKKNCQNLENLSSFQRLEILFQETREQQSQSNEKVQYQQKRESQSNKENLRFESFQVYESANTFAQSPRHEQKNIFPQEPLNQNIYFSVINCELNPTQENNSINQNQEVNFINNEQTLNPFRNHQQKQSESPRTMHKSKNADENTHYCQQENNMQQVQTNEEREETGEQDLASQDNYEMSVVDLKNDTNSCQMSESESIKQKYLQLQEENDRLLYLIKNLNADLDEQTKLKTDAEQKLNQLQQNVFELERNAENLLEENQDIKKQCEELNNIASQQSEIENKYLLLEEKTRFQEEQLSLLRQQDNEKQTALTNIQENIRQINNTNGDVSQDQIEEYVQERVLQLIETQNTLQNKNQELIDQLDEKEQIIRQYEQDILQLNAQIQENEFEKQNIQQYVEDRVQDELTEFYNKQKENIDIQSQNQELVEKLNQELLQTKEQLAKIEETKKIEVQLLNKEIESQQLKISDLCLQVLKQDTAKETDYSVKNLQGKVVDYEKQVEDLIALNNMYINQINDLSTQHSKCYLIKTENESMKFQIDSQIFQIKDKESEIRQYQIKLEIKQNEWNNLQTSYELKLSEKQQEINMLSEQLMRQLNQMDTQQREIIDRIEYYETENQQYQDNEMLIQYNNDLKQQQLNLEFGNRQYQIQNQNTDDDQQIYQQDAYNMRQYDGNQETNQSKREYEMNDDESETNNADNYMNEYNSQTMGTNY